MINKIVIPDLRKSGRINFPFLLLSMILLLCMASDLLSQSVEFTLNQRRRYDQISVEIWARDLGTSPNLGFASLIVQYNKTYLTPTTVQNPSQTDSIDKNINQLNPVISINSGFNAGNGYNALGTQSYSQGYFSLEKACIMPLCSFFYSTKAHPNPLSNPLPNVYLTTTPLGLMKLGRGLKSYPLPAGRLR